jgi:Na+-transporting methylmalonyl-CoA/oxaloacetate decarboxylase gamma subunit
VDIVIVILLLIIIIILLRINSKLPKRDLVEEAINRYNKEKEEEMKTGQ